MSYNNILNPLTNEFVELNTSEGINVLKNYVSYVQNGGSKKPKSKRKSKSKESKRKSKSKESKPKSKSKPATKKADAEAQAAAVAQAAQAAKEAEVAAKEAAQAAAKAAAIAKALEQERLDAIEYWKYKNPYSETPSDEDDMLYAHQFSDENMSDS